MLYKKYAGRLLDKDLIDNVNNYINVLKRQYKLETSVRDKPVLLVDNLLLRLLLALLFLFTAYIGSQPCSLVDVSVKKLDNRVSNTMENEAASPCDSGYEDDEYNSKYYSKLEYDEDGLPFTDTDIKKLKLILYEHVTILAVKVKDRLVLVMKTYKVYQHSNPFLYPIVYIIAVGLHNNAFAASKKESKLKEPIFQEPEPVLLRAYTAGRYIKRLEQDVGYGYLGVFQFYINPRVKCDVQAAYLDQPSDKVLMKVLGNMFLTYDPLALTGPTLEDAHAIQQHPKIIKLRQRRDALMKKEAEAALRRKKKSLQDQAEKKARERYFMDNDTRELEEESDLLLNDKDKGKSTTITYALEERACIANMLCRSHGDLTEPARRRSTIPCLSEAVMKQEDVAVLSLLPLECDPRQCLFCIGDERLPFLQQTFYHHLKRFAPNAKISCPHPTCQKNGVVLDGVSHFKNHALGVHKIKLRLPKVESF
ncbi:hypothetical protein K469DRAFT_718709 [Zopfia rhizophila CBS 207.26]|uniref:Uncharacterized protein n=1 Tax=Zopfia rhizophila CBS 207.26 TaxID=1314779 RepID=A0A6A6ENN1_9PEZI|nr:hypothetical protein K469DRAFT_718709 [Zopfia rhizophila CBS 207.26]